MKAIDTRILIQVNKEACIQKIGGLELPADANEYETANVLSIGKKIKEVGELNEGDTILIYPGAGKEFIKDGQKFRIISVNEIIVVL